MIYDKVNLFIMIVELQKAKVRECQDQFKHSFHLINIVITSGSSISVTNVYMDCSGIDSEKIQPRWWRRPEALIFVYFSEFLFLFLHGNFIS